MLCKKKSLKQLSVAVAVATLLSAGSVYADPLALNLEQSIDLALKKSPTLDVSQAQLDKAKWQFQTAKSGFGPTVAFTGTAAEAKTQTSGMNIPGIISIPAGSVITDNYEARMDVKYPLLTGGKKEGVIGQAQSGLKAAKFGFDATSNQLKLDATNAYYRVLQAQRMVQLTQEAYDTLAAHLQNAQAHFEAGTVAKSDVLRAEVELANTKQNLIKAQNGVKLATAAFNSIVNLPMGTDIQLQDVLSNDKINMTLSQCIAIAFQKRPEIHQLYAGIEANQYGLKAAESGQKWSAGLGGSYSLTSRDELPPKKDSWTVAVSATYNLFDSQLTKNQVRSAQADLDQAKATLKKSEQQIELQVRQSYLNIVEADERIVTAQTAVDKAKEDYQIAQVRYNAGVGTNIDVLDAQTALTQAKTNYVQALYDYNTSKAALAQAIGQDVH